VYGREERGWRPGGDVRPIVLLNLLVDTSPATPQAANPITGLLPFFLIFAIFYFLVIRPMQRQRKTQQKMLSELQNGQTVVTSGGIVGAIVAMNDDDTLILRVKPDNVKLQVARSAVSSTIQGEAKK
jgi:preprotein translocase subunit YajC